MSDGSSRPFTFGVLVLPNEPWPDLVARWRRLEAAGVDSIWGCDHFTDPNRPANVLFEGWTALMGMAMSTTRVRIGLLVGAITSRPPTLVAKHAQVVDHASGGRLDVGLGAGGAPTDQAMWGQEQWSVGERAARFDEYVRVVESLMQSAPVTHEGRWYSTTNPTMGPGFVQLPRPPLVLAAHGPRTLATVARHGDTWSTFGPTFDDACRCLATLERECEAIGRDPATIRRSALVGLVEDTAWTSIGEFVRLVGKWRNAGFDEIVFYDPPYARPGVPVADPAIVDEVLGDVIPALRRRV